MNNLITVAKKELQDFSRSHFYLVMFGLLTLAMIISVVVSSADFNSKVADYNQYVAELTATGSQITAPPPQLFPLQLLRGSVEYLEIVGSLLAIIIGYGMIAKEKYRGTLQLLFTRPLPKHTLAGGKLIALATIWLAVIGGIMALSAIALLVVGGASLQLVDYIRLIIICGLAWAYLTMWSALGMGLAALFKRLGTALIVALVVWLSFVLIIPQIGDTTDPDNQVPGGLFNSLQLAKPDEQAVMDKFSRYETIRNSVEVSSIAKHYERASFAFLGTKDQFNQKPISEVTAKTLANSIPLVIVTGFSTLLATLMSVKSKLIRKER